jgi:hypothetical protein
MTDSPQPTAPRAALNDVLQHLFEFNFVITEMFARMSAFQESGLAAPDAEPIPEVARRLIYDVTHDVAGRYSRRELRLVARMLGETLEAISENLFFVDPEFVEEHLDDESEPAD